MSSTLLLNNRAPGDRPDRGAYNDPKQSSFEAGAFDLRGKRAVIVEDEGITQLQLRVILRDKGADVVGAASNGADAIEVVRRTRPDFVLMDIRMPKMDGLEATRILTRDGEICIVMLTAFPEESLRKEVQESGACGYILKPITSDTLIPQLKSILQAWHNEHP